MKAKIYSIYDIKTCVYNTLMLLSNDEHAIRQVAMLLRQAKGIMHEFPQDYRLMSLGTFDDSNGTIEATTPELVIELAQVQATMVPQKGDEQ